MADKFDLHTEKKIPSIICDNTPGSKVRKLRLKNDMTIKELAEKLKIDKMTLMNVENNKINVIKAPYYWKLICDYFNVNNVQYLGLNNMKENLLEDKLLKIRACSGARTWEDLSIYLGYSRGFIYDLMRGRIPQKKYLDKINSTLEEFK